MKQIHKKCVDTNTVFFAPANITIGYQNVRWCNETKTMLNPGFVYWYEEPGEGTSWQYIIASTGTQFDKHFELLETIVVSEYAAYHLVGMDILK